MRLLVTIFFFTVGCSVFAQSTYHKLPTSDARWNEKHSWLASGSVSSPYEWHECTDELITNGTIAFDGHVYTRLKLSRSCNVQPIGGTFDPSAYFSYQYSNDDFIYFREDTITKLCYALRPNSTNNEMLLFDLNMNIGVYPYTFFNDVYNKEPILFIVALDSIMLEDGWHKRWRIAEDSAGEPFTDLIEGVGLTTGWNAVYGLEAPFEHFDALQCHTRNSSLVYQAEGNTCEVINNVFDHSVRDQWRLWPMPTSDHIEVSGPTENIVGYEVIDMNGRVLVGGSWNEQPIDCSSFSAGVYLLDLKDRTGSSAVMLKILKQ